MARRLILGGYQRRAGRASAAVLALFTGGEQLGRTAHASGQPREANPFRGDDARGVRRGGDRWRLAAMGWDAGWEAAEQETRP